MNKDPVPPPVPSEGSKPPKKQPTVGEVISEFVQDPIYTSLQEQYTALTARVSAQEACLREAVTRGQQAREISLRTSLNELQHQAMSLKHLLGRINRLCFEAANAAKGELKLLGREAHDQRMRDQRAKKEEAQRAHQLKMAEAINRRRGKTQEEHTKRHAAELDREIIRERHFRRLVAGHLEESVYDRLRADAEHTTLTEVLARAEKEKNTTPA